MRASTCRRGARGGACGRYRARSLRWCRRRGVPALGFLHVVSRADEPEDVEFGRRSVAFEAL
eukprot:15265068-Alexandrium_andersonii.AAC.1